MHLSSRCVQTHIASPLGPITLAACDGRLVGVWFNSQAHQPDLSHCAQASTLPVFSDVSSQLAQYFAGQRTRFDLPISWYGGTPFQQRVWQALLNIPAGSTCSYLNVATSIGRPQAVRAVGAAIGRNPLSIVVPCHRVVGSNGKLTGYAGGLPRKTALLQLEGAL